MKKLLIVLLLLFPFCVGSSADDMYMVEMPDDSISIVYHVSDKPLVAIIDELGYTGYPISAIDASDLPETRIDRKYWKKNDVPIGKKIDINEAKKKKDEDAQAVIDSDKEKVYQKMGISKKEWEDLNGFGS